MASRKKPDPAALRTVGIFTGLTPIEEAERLAREQDGLAGDAPAEPRMPGDMIPTAEAAAVTWLLEETQDRGDQIRVAKGNKGGVVLLLIRGDAPEHPYSTVNLRLSRRQWEQLKRLALKDNIDAKNSMVPEVPKDAQRQASRIDLVPGGRPRVLSETEKLVRPASVDRVELPFPTDLVDDLPFKV